MLKTLLRLNYDIRHDIPLVLKDLLSFVVMYIGAFAALNWVDSHILGFLLFSLVFLCFRWTIDKNLDRLVTLINEKNGHNN